MNTCNIETYKIVIWHSYIWDWNNVESTRPDAGTIYPERLGMICIMTHWVIKGTVGLSIRAH